MNINTLNSNNKNPTYIFREIRSKRIAILVAKDYSNLLKISCYHDKNHDIGALGGGRLHHVIPTPNQLITPVTYGMLYCA